MKKSVLTLLSLILTGSLLSGCILRSGVEVMFGEKTQQHREIIQQDQIIGMGLASHNGEQKGLIFVGKQYNYLAEDYNHRLQNILRALPSNERILYNSLPLKFELADDRHSFSGAITLYYPTPKDKIATEKANALKSLGMNRICNLRVKGKDNYYYCAKITIDGEIYQGTTLNEKQMNYRFKNDIPIIIEKNYTIKSHPLPKKIAYYTLAPISLALDTVLFPIEYIIVCSQDDCKIE